MDNYCCVAIDLGATSGRVTMGTFDGQKIKMKVLTRFSNNIIPVGNHLFWDIAGLYNEILSGLKTAAEEGHTIQSIGIDTWGCDFAFFGKDGQLLGLPYCYRDGYTEGAQQKFFRKMPQEEVYRRTGIQFMDFNSLFQLDTLKRNGCTALDASDKILFIPDAIIYMLTGEAICEYTVASTSQMINPQTKELDTEILKALGIGREKFGRMTMPGTMVGRLTGQVQKACGLHGAGVTAVAGHDTASAVAAVPAMTDRYAYLSCGTWSLLGIESPQPIINDASYRKNFTNEGGVCGTTRFLKNICGLWLFEQCRKEFKDGPEDVAELAASCTATGFESLIDPDAPCFSHPVSMTGAIREYCIATGQEAPETPADYCRCIFRSLALRYRQVLETLERLVPEGIDVLHVIGGGSMNPYLMQYTANATGKKVIAGPSECTALGNVLLQLKAAGLVDGLQGMRRISAASVTTRTYLPEDREAWERLYERFVSISRERHQ